MSGVGAEEGKAWFTSDLDSMNHALAPGDPIDSAVEVAVVTLDGLAAPVVPTFIKIDVEGFETRGACGGRDDDALGGAALRADGDRTAAAGGSASPTRRFMRRCAISASPRRVTTCWRVRSRRLPAESWNRSGGNTLYVRDIAECRERVRSAARFRLVNREI